MKLSNRAENNLFHKVRKNNNLKNISETCINDEIPECKCVNSPIKDDIALHKKIITTKTQMKAQTNLSTTSINNCKTSENVIRTIETPNDNDVINDNLAVPTLKEKFQTNHHFSSAETKLKKRKNSSPIIRELYTPVRT